MALLTRGRTNGIGACRGIRASAPPSPRVLWLFITVVVAVTASCGVRHDRFRGSTRGQPAGSAPAVAAARTCPADGGAGPSGTLAELEGPEKIRFAVIGDYGRAGNNEAKVAALVKGWHPDLVITTGDNNYPIGAADTIDANIGQYYHEFIAPYLGRYGCGAADNRFFPSLGNHDWGSAEVKPYRDYFALPGNERYYDQIAGPVHLFALDSDGAEPDGVTADSVQAMWLKNRLAASTAKWKVVYMHHPPYSSGPHRSSEHMRWPYKEWGADIVFAGHDHDYERLEIDGFPYVVNGLGGASIYRLGPPIPGSLARFDADFGAAVVDADAAYFTLRFFAVDGRVIDVLTLSSSRAPAKTY